MKSLRRLPQLLIALALVVSSFAWPKAALVEAAPAPSGKVYFEVVNKTGNLNGPPITFNITTDDHTDAGRVHLIIRANDVDEKQGEFDLVYWNGAPTHPVNLSGQGSQDSTSVFAIDPATLAGDNIARPVSIQVTHNPNAPEAVSNPGWVVTAKWAQIVIDGGPRDAAYLSTLEGNITPSGGTRNVTINVASTAILDGNYNLELSLVDNNGYNYGLASESYNNAKAGDVFPETYNFNNVPVPADGIYNVNAILFGKDNNGNEIVQDLQTFKLNMNAKPDNIGFTFGAGTPLGFNPDPFHPDTLNYTAAVPYSVNSVNPLATIPGSLPPSSTAEISLNGGAYAPYPGAADNLPLQVGRNTIKVRTQTPDGSGPIYTFTVDREPILDNLVPSAGNGLSPAFDPNTTSPYVTEVSNTETPITITPTINTPSAPAPETIEYRINGGAYAPVGNGDPTGDLPLRAGTNTIDFKVTSADGHVSKTYTVTVKRRPALTNLVPSVGQLKPDFAGNELNYKSYVPSGTDKITGTPTTTPDATIQYRINGADYHPVASGNATGDLPLKYGSNIVEMVLTPTDGTPDLTTVYTWEIIRDYPYVPNTARITAGTDAKGQVLLVNQLIGKELTMSGKLFSEQGHEMNVPAVQIDANGYFTVSGVSSGKYTMAITVNGPSGTVLAGLTKPLIVDTSSTHKIEGEMIDPRATVTDASTGKALAGAKVSLYWADTELNRAKGRTPGTLVALPELANFTPYKNQNAQLTQDDGTYGWAVLNEADYYVIGEKDGYETFDSRKDTRSESYGGNSYARNGIIHADGYAVKYSFAMKPVGSNGGEKPEPETPKPETEELDTHIGYMKGLPDGTFRPEKSITRAELAAVLTRIIPRKAGESADMKKITDVPAKHWAYSSIATAIQQGWLTPSKDGKFNPSSNVTRAEMAKIVFYIKSKEGSIPAAAGKYSDVTNKHWAARAINGLAQLGLFGGFVKGDKFLPGQAITRAEAVTLLNALTNRNPLNYESSQVWSDVKPNHWAFKDIMEASLDHSFTRDDNGNENWKK